MTKRRARREEQVPAVVAEELPGLGHLPHERVPRGVVVLPEDEVREAEVLERVPGVEALEGNRELGEARDEERHDDRQRHEEDVGRGDLAAAELVRGEDDPGGDEGRRHHGEGVREPGVLEERGEPERRVADPERARDVAVHRVAVERRHDDGEVEEALPRARGAALLAVEIADVRGLVAHVDRGPREEEREEPREGVDGAEDDADRDDDDGRPGERRDESAGSAARRPSSGTSRTCGGRR